MYAGEESGNCACEDSEGDGEEELDHGSVTYINNKNLMDV